MMTNILTGHTSRDTAYEVKDYPYGYKLRTSIFYWIESKEGKGDRLCTQTINPINGKLNASKYSSYRTFMYLNINEEGQVKHDFIDAYNEEIFHARFGFIIKHIGEIGLLEVQKNNLRTNYYQHVKGNALYDMANYTQETLAVFTTYVKRKLHHIISCPFEQLVNFEEAPKPDKEALI